MGAKASTIPIYAAENSPASIRGACKGSFTFYSGSVACEDRKEANIILSGNELANVDSLRTLPRFRSKSHRR